jgi:hypothetical protein
MMQSENPSSSPRERVSERLLLTVNAAPLHDDSLHKKGDEEDGSSELIVDVRSGIMLQTIKCKEEEYMRDAEKTIGNLIDKAGVSIISSVDEAGFPNTKAMIPPRKREGIKHIYFTTNTSSMRVRQYIDNPKACVYFFDKRFFRGIMLKGTMEVLRDKVTKEMI